MRQYFGVLRARAWTILACVVVVFSLVAIHTFRTTLVYRASARLLIERVLPQATPFEGIQERTDEQYFATHVNLITSQAVLEKALEQEQVARAFADLNVSNPGLLGQVRRELAQVFRSGSARSLEPWELLRSRVQVAPVRGTNLVDVAVLGPDAQQDALIANAVCEAYVKYTVAMRRESAIGTFQMLQQQRKEQQQALTGAEDALLAYREGAEMPELGSSQENAAALERLQSLNAQYTQAELHRTALGAVAEAVRQVEQGSADVESLLAVEQVRGNPALAALLDSIGTEYNKTRLRRVELQAAAEAIRDAQQEGDACGCLLAVERVRVDPAARELHGRLTQVKLDLDAALCRYGEKHPQVMTLKEQDKALSSRLSEALAAVLRSIESEDQMLAVQERAQHTRLVAAMQGAIAAAAQAVEAQQREITQALERLGRTALDQARKVHQYARLQRDVDRQARVFDVIVDRMKEVDLAKDVGVTNVSLVERASVPRLPIKPRVKSALFLGAAFGLILGIGLAFGLEHLDSTVKTPEDVERRLGVPWLGYVPEIRVDGAGPLQLSDCARHAMTHPSSPATESFRSVRTNVYFSGERGEVKSLVVTSPGPGEGKTVLAANLAAAVAQDGKRVLLVDADFRRPRLHTAFGFQKAPGLSNILAQGVSLQDAVHQPREGSNGEADNLRILCAGTKVPNPSELLGGEALAAFARQVRQQYDVVIYDCCPTVFVADAAPLAGGADGVIVVLKVAHTRREAAERAKKQLLAVKAKIIGGVLNGLRPKMLRRYGYHGYDYYYYDYRRYEGYSDKDEEAA